MLAGLFPLIQAEIGYWYSQYRPALSEEQVISANSEACHTSYIKSSFSLFIPKLQVKADIVENVSVTNEKEYFEALSRGIAHAINTPLPSDEIGNTYLFAHSTANFWEIQRYSAVFTLLHQLKAGDKIYLFHLGKEFIYEVGENEVKGAFDLSPLEQEVYEPTLTLQTCDPPGIPINRRIVTAKLTEMRSCSD